MKNKWIILGFIFARGLYAVGAPIQQIDIVNMLGTGGSASPVVVTFNNNTTTPCISTTLPYLSAITIWVGSGYPCASPVNLVTATPAANFLGNIYANTPITTNISDTLYSTQIIITEASAPIFDPNNGAILMQGTAQANAVSNWTKIK